MSPSVAIAHLFVAAIRWLDAVRIRAHLRRTERSLRAADTDHLDAERRRRRHRALDALRRYRRRGRFPTNRAEPERAPQFVGANGVPCAVAALMLADGERDPVKQVAATDNAVRIGELDDGPVLDWLDRNGLSQAEAARIQPMYPSDIYLVTDCGPVSCAVARALAGAAAVGVFAVAEVVGYRLADGLFPDNPFKRRGTLAYLTVMNLLLAPILGVLLYALFP